MFPLNVMNHGLCFIDFMTWTKSDHNKWDVFFSDPGKVSPSFMLQEQKVTFK